MKISRQSAPSSDASHPPAAQLAEFVLGRLDDDSSAEVEQHLAGCADCRQQLLTPADDTLIALVRAGCAAAGEDVPVPAFVAAGSHRPVCDYEVLEQLGAGGMGVVWKARQKSLPRLVALKRLHAGRPLRDELLRRFRREAEAVARLQHPHIVQIYEVGEQDGEPYLALEYVAGGSLAHKLTAGPLAATAAASLVETLARAIHFAHEHGILHRDLKPGNVLLAEDGTPKVTDFGLAKLLQSEETADTQSGAILGTPSYMAPEQADGVGAVGPAADVYSLGAILYETLTVRPPFRGPTALDTLAQVRERDPVSPRALQPNVPRDLQTICLKCLHKEPARRYARAQALADDLGRFLRGEPIQARPVSRRERLWKWMRRQPAQAALLLLTTLLLAALVTGGLAYDARLRAALQQAKANETEARRQHERADTGYRSARAALDRILDRLEQHPPGEVPGLKELERQQCQDVLAFYEGLFAGAEDPSPDVRLDAAYAFRAAARIQALLGHAAEAVALYGRAIALIEALPPDPRDLPPAQYLLAGCYGDRGLFRSTPADGEADLVKAVALREQVLQAEPDNPKCQEGLAVAEYQLGKILQAAGRWVEARPHFARAAALRTALVARHPREDDYRYALAETLSAVGVVDMNTGNGKRAQEAYRKSEELLEPLVAGHPENVRGALALAMTYINWSYCLAAEGKMAEALARRNRAVEQTEGALRQEPTYLGMREVARNAHGLRAQLFEGSGRWKDAVKDWDRVVELDSGPDAWVRRILRAVALIHAGEYARVRAEADALEAARGLPDEGLYNVACLHALAVEPVRDDGRLPAGEWKALAQRHADRAVGILTKLHARGYFKDTSHAEALASDNDLKSLRGRDDFRKLLADTNKGKRK